MEKTVIEPLQISSAEGLDSKDQVLIFEKLGKRKVAEVAEALSHVWAQIESDRASTSDGVVLVLPQPHYGLDVARFKGSLVLTAKSLPF